MQGQIITRSDRIATLYDLKLNHARATNPDLAIQTKLATIVQLQLTALGFTRAEAYTAHNAAKAGRPANQKAVDAWRQSVLIALQVLIEPINTRRRNTKRR